MNIAESIYLNQDKNLIYITDKSGIKVYDTLNYQLLIKLDPHYFGLSGDVSKFLLFHSSEIFVFSFLENINDDSINQIIYNNRKIKKHSLILFDIKNNSILAKITMKNSIEINDFIITKYFIIIMIENKNKAILFNTSNLKYNQTINGAYSGKIFFSDQYYQRDNNEGNINDNRCMLTYINHLNSSEIIIKEFIFNDDYSKILGNKTNKFQVYFNTQIVNKIEIISNYLVICSNIGNKIHIFDINHFQFKYCLYLGNFFYELSGLDMNLEKNIISIVTNNKYLKLYKLSKLYSVCKCHAHKDEEVCFEEKRGIYNNLIHKLNVGRNEVFTRYKINYDNNIKINKSLVIFDKSKKNTIFVIQLNRTVTKLLFDSEKPKDFIVGEIITLPLYSKHFNEK